MSNFSIGAEATEASQFPTGHKNVIKCQSKARQSKTKLAQRNVIKIYKHRKVGAAPDFWRSWKYFLLEKKMKQLKNDFFSFGSSPLPILCFLLATLTQSFLAKHRFCRCPSVMWSRTRCWEDRPKDFEPKTPWSQGTNWTAVLLRYSHCLTSNSCLIQSFCYSSRCAVS